MSAQIDNLRSSGSSFSAQKFAGALAKYRELGVSPYVLFGGQHFEGCFANGGMPDNNGDPADANDSSLAPWSEDENVFCDSPLPVSARQYSATRC